LKEETQVYHFVPRSFIKILKLNDPQIVKNYINACLFKLSHQRGKA
jgi:hypothetical protein